MGVQYFCDVAVYSMALTNTQKIFRNHIKITPDIKKIYTFQCDQSVAKPALEPCYKFQCFKKAGLLEIVLRLSVIWYHQIICYDSVKYNINLNCKDTDRQSIAQHE